MKHGFDDSNKSKVEILDKEEVYALLAEAIQSGQLPSVDDDTAFVTKLKDPHTGLTHRVCFLTQAQYNQLVAEGKLIGNTYYFITDDTTAEDLESAIQEIIDGTTQVGNATKADNAENAKNTDFTNAQTKFYAYGYHQDGWYATIPASENGGEGYYWVEFADDRNNAYNLGIVHRFGGVNENVNSPLFLAIEDNDYLTQCFLYMKEQNDGSVKIQVLAQSSSTSTREVEIENSTISIKKIR